MKTLIDADVVDSDTGADTLDIVDETHLAIITHHTQQQTNICPTQDGLVSSPLHYSSSQDTKHNCDIKIFNCNLTPRANHDDVLEHRAASPQHNYHKNNASNTLTFNNNTQDYLLNESCSLVSNS